jgi:hypothetical protein
MDITAAPSKVTVDLKTISTSDIPQGFMQMCRGDEEAARKAYVKTLEWRKARGVDSILSTPQDHFTDILRYYPHAIHGKSKDGTVVLYELVGKARPKELYKLGRSSSPSATLPVT